MKIHFNFLDRFRNHVAHKAVQLAVAIGAQVITRDASISAKVIRANGTEEDLGIISGSKVALTRSKLRFLGKNPNEYQS